MFVFEWGLFLCYWGMVSLDYFLLFVYSVFLDLIHIYISLNLGLSTQEMSDEIVEIEP